MRRRNVFSSLAGARRQHGRPDRFGSCRTAVVAGPIASLDMPGMTMVFKVGDPKMLDRLKEGDKVKFAAEKVNGAITVTAIEPAAK